MKTTKKPAAKKAPRTDWRKVSVQLNDQIQTANNQIQLAAKEIYSLSAAVSRQEEVTKEMHAQYVMQKTRADQYETANARARFHWENRSPWFYLKCAFRAITGRPNNTNGIHL